MYDETKGVYFSPVIALDLHPISIFGEKIKTISTASGNRLSLTENHMVVTHTARGEKLVPAGSVKPGMFLCLANDERDLTEVTEVTTMDPAAARGLANVLTGPETIVVNGLLGSHLTASSAERPGRFML